MVRGPRLKGLAIALALLGACDESAGGPSPDAQAVDAGGHFDAGPGADVEAGMDADVQLDAGPSLLDAQLDAADGANTLDGDSADAGALPADAGMAIVCSVQAPTSCPSPMPTYGDIAPIIRERCEACHSPRWLGPWPLDTYGHVADWQDTIRTELLACTMPPPEAGVPMTNEERLQILTWLRCGLPM